jgi:Flp pilus assembly protein TadD
VRLTLKIMADDGLNGTVSKLCARLAVPVAAMALLVACVADSADNAPPDQASVRAKPSTSLSGNYLAGRQARRQFDTAAAADYMAASLAADNDNQILLRRTLVVFLADGRVDEAADLAQRRIAASPKAAMARLTLAVAALKANDEASAIAHLEMVSGKGFVSLVQPLLLAWSKAGSGDFAGGLATLEGMQTRGGFDVFRYFHSGLMQDLAGSPAAAAESLAAAMKAGAGNSLRANLAYAGALGRSQGSDAAVKWLQDYVARVGHHPVTSAALADIADGRGLPVLVRDARDGAAETFHGAASVLPRGRSGETRKILIRLALYLRPDAEAARMMLGEIMEAEEGFEHAIEVYQGISEDSPYRWEARIRVADNLNELGRVDETLELLRTMAEERKSDVSALTTAAGILRAQERYSEAAVEYDRAVARIDKIEDRHWTLLYARGIALERSKKWGRAEADFLRALELKPNQPLVLNYLGYSWIEQGLNLDRAQKMIEDAVEQRPNDGYIVDSLGWVFYRLGKYPDAVKQLERAVELRPEDPVINDHLGDAFWRVGRKLEARFQWRHALALGVEEDLIAGNRNKIASGLDGDDS